MDAPRPTPTTPRIVVVATGPDGAGNLVAPLRAACGEPVTAHPDPATVDWTQADLVVVVVSGDGQPPSRVLRAARSTRPSLPAILVAPGGPPGGLHPHLDLVLEGLPAPAVLRATIRAALVAGDLHARLTAERERLGALRSSMQDGLTVLSPEGRILDANERLAEITGVPVTRLVGCRPPFPFWPAELQATYGRRLARALAGRAAGEGDRVYRRPDGEERHVIVSLAPLRGAGGDGAFVSTVKDVTGRRVAEEELRRSDAAHRRLASQQAALARVAAAVAAGEAPEAVFALVAREVATLLGVEAGGVARYDDDGHTATLLGAWTSAEALRLDPGTRLPLTGESVTAMVRRTGRPARIDDYRELPAEALGGGHAPRRSSVAAPIRIGGRLWGTVGALSDRPGGLAPEAEDRLEEFAGLVALAIAGAEARMQLTSLAETDALTGLPNRRLFDASLAQALREARDAGRPLSLMMIDIDHFKAVNDTFGHDAGDGVLRELGFRLDQVSRGSDVVARVGGEEFAWILDGLGAATGAVVAERLMTAVRARPFPVAGPITVSAGVAEAHEGDDEGVLRRRADAALYEAKRAGRDRVAVAGASGEAPGHDTTVAVAKA